MSAFPNLGTIVAGAIGSFGSTKGTKAKRAIGPIIANITIEEKHHDEVTITEHPVEMGANIADHAFKRPNEVTIRVAWSSSATKPASLLGGISGALTTSSPARSRTRSQALLLRPLAGPHSAISQLPILVS